MIWFKHFTGYRNDPKVRILREEFGIAGAAVPIFMVEIVAESLGSTNPTPYLTYSRRTWAEFVGIDVRKLNKILARMQEINLFEVTVEDDGKITFGSPKILKYCDEYTRILKREGKIPHDVSHDKSPERSPARSPVRSMVRKKEVERKKEDLASASSDLEGQTPPHDEAIVRQLREAASKIGVIEQPKVAEPEKTSGKGNGTKPNEEEQGVKFGKIVEHGVDPGVADAIIEAWVKHRSGDLDVYGLAVVMDSQGVKGHTRMEVYRILGFG